MKSQKNHRTSTNKYQSHKIKWYIFAPQCLQLYHALEILLGDGFSLMLFLTPPSRNPDAEKPPHDLHEKVTLAHSGGFYREEFPEILGLVETAAFLR